METWDLVVVGGGLAGLAAAVRVASAGRKVLVCERQATMGGRAATERVGGFCLNQGPHAIYRGGAASRVLGELGVGLAGAPPRAVGYAVQGGKLHTFPSGPVSLLSTSLMPAAAKWELGVLLASAGRLDPAKFSEKSVSELIAALATHPAARAALGAFFRLATYCDEHDAQCAEAALRQFKRSIDPGVFYIEGGWQTLVDELARRARQAGASIEVGAGIERVDPDGEGFVLTRAGEAIRAGRVLITAAPRAASALLGGRSPALAGFAAAAVPLRGACLDVALSSVPRRDVRVMLGIDRPVFAALQSETVTVAPAGGGVVHLIRYLREGERGGPEHRAELEEILCRMQPGWQPLAVRQRWLPSIVVAQARIEAKTGLAGRPGVAVPGVPGAFVAGDWVGPEGILLDASLASASEAAGQILAGAAPARAVA